MLRSILKPKFLLAIAVTAALFGAVACSAEEAATPLPAAAAAAAAPAAAGPAAAVVAAPGAAMAPKAAAAAAGAAAPVAPAAPVGAVAKAEAIKAAREVEIVAPTRGKRVEIPRRQQPLAAQVGTAVGEQHLVYTAMDMDNQKPWREGGENRSWVIWAFMPAFLFDRNNSLVQGYATAYTLSEDGKTYTFHINPNAVYTDGTPITAASVKWSFEFAVRPEDQVGWGGSTRDVKYIVGADAAIAGESEEITGLVALDDHTLEMNLTALNPIFPLRMATWMQGTFKAEAAEQDDAFFKHAIGAGPFTYVADDAAGTVVMTASDHWWEPPPVIQKITGQEVKDNQTQLIMFENGDTDIIYARPGLQPTVHDPSHPMHQYLVDIPYAGLGRGYRFNTAREPFQDVNIRKALAHSLDMSAIVGAVYGSPNFRSESILNENMRCWDPNNFKGYEYDPEMAKMYLAQSEYKVGSAVPLIHNWTRPNSTIKNLGLQAIQSSWKEILDIDLKITQVERGGEVPPDVNLMSNSSGSYIPDPGVYLNGIVPTSASSAMHVNDELDAKVDAANIMALDDPGRCAALQEIDRIFMENYYILPVTTIRYHYLVQPWILGFETSVNNDLQSIPFMKIGDKTR